VLYLRHSQKISPTLVNFRCESPQLGAPAMLLAVDLLTIGITSLCEIAQVRDLRRN